MSLWWLNLDKIIEDVAKSCVACTSVKTGPPTAPMHPWKWPAKPWQRIHIDFAGPFLGKSFMLIVDSHSKWPEMTATSASSTLCKLRQVFASYGLPQQVVMDNGPQFVSQEFAAFMKSNGIKHTRCAPYHPASNGAVERLVQTFKKAMQAGRKDGMSISHCLSNFLLTYRSTPHITTGVSPSSLFMGRELRTRFDLIKPDINKRVCEKQAQQKTDHDTRTKLRTLQIGDKVMVKNFRAGNPWIAGTITQKDGPVSYTVCTDNGQIWKRHLDHIKKLKEHSTLDKFTSTEREFEELPTIGESANFEIDSPTNDSTGAQATADLNPQGIHDEIDILLRGMGTFYFSVGGMWYIKLYDQT